MNREKMLKLVGQFANSVHEGERQLGRWLEYVMSRATSEDDILQIAREKTGLLRDALDNFDNEWLFINGE